MKEKGKEMTQRALKSTPQQRVKDWYRESIHLHAAIGQLDQPRKEPG